MSERLLTYQPGKLGIEKNFSFLNSRLPAPGPRRGLVLRRGAGGAGGGGGGAGPTASVAQSGARLWRRGPLPNNPPPPAHRRPGAGRALKTSAARHYVFFSSFIRGFVHEGHFWRVMMKQSVSVYRNNEKARDFSGVSFLPSQTPRKGINWTRRYLK